MSMAENYLSQTCNRLRGMPENTMLNYVSEEDAETFLRSMTPTSLEQATDTDQLLLFTVLASLYHHSDLRNKKLIDSYDASVSANKGQAEKHQREMEEQQREVETYRAEKLSLKTQVEKLQHLANQKTSPYFPRPPMYDGNRDDLGPFQYKLAAKLEANTDWFPTEKIALGYCFARLTGEAQKRMLPRLSQNSVWNVQTVEQFQKALTIDFGDRSTMRAAREYIERLRQGDSSFVDYLFDFHAHIGAAKFSEEEQRSEFIAGLDDKIAMSVIYKHDFADLSLEDLVSFCREIDILQNGYSSAESSRSSSPEPAIPTVSAAPAVHTSSITTESVSMDQLRKKGQQLRRPGPITAEEKARRISSNLCLYCGDASHPVESCPKLRARAQRQC